jgi:hypothetical protein
MKTHRRSYRLRLFVLVLLVVPGNGACLHYRVNALGAAPIEAPMRLESDTGLVNREQVTIWSLLYGLGKKGRSRLECDGQGLQEVTLSSPPHYTLLTILTLGLVSPKRLQAKCTKATPAPGGFPPDSGGR